MGQRARVTLRPGTRAFALYGAPTSEEDFFCSYGLDPSWVPRLEAAGLVVSGVGDAGEPRAVELPRHPFFLSTLFLPQSRSSAQAPHPVLVGFASAVRAFAESRPSRPRSGGEA